MENVWAIYYHHWARESHQKKRRDFVEKSIQKTITILHSWVECSSFKIRTQKDLEACQQRMIRDLPYIIELLIPDNKDVDQKMNVLKDIGEYLFPKTLMDDYEIYRGDLMFLDWEYEGTTFFSIRRAEQRVINHCGQKNQDSFSMIWKLSFPQIRQLDGILALF